VLDRTGGALNGKGPGVTFTLLGRRECALLLTEGDKGKADLASTLQQLYGLTPPETPQSVRAAGLELRWAGPGQWQAYSPQPGLAAKLQRQLGSAAAIIDQSDARASLTLAGGKARDVLAKGCSLDLHPRAFRTGDVALTAIAHMATQLVQLSEAPVYELSVFRSMAGSLWSWASASATEFGYEVLDDE
jgi:sarcosine oxidase subunit gamma